MLGIIVKFLLAVTRAAYWPWLDHVCHISEKNLRTKQMVMARTHIQILFFPSREKRTVSVLASWAQSISPHITLKDIFIFRRKSGLYFTMVCQVIPKPNPRHLWERDYIAMIIPHLISVVYNYIILQCNKRYLQSLVTQGLSFSIQMYDLFIRLTGT